MNDDSISVTLTRAQAEALLACAEFGVEEGYEYAPPRVSAARAQAFKAALRVLRGALGAPLCPCGAATCGGCGLW